MQLTQRVNQLREGLVERMQTRELELFTLMPYQLEHSHNPNVEKFFKTKGWSPSSRSSQSFDELVEGLTRGTSSSVSTMNGIGFRSTEKASVKKIFPEYFDKDNGDVFIHYHDFFSNTARGFSLINGQHEKADIFSENITYDNNHFSTTLIESDLVLAENGNL